MHERRTRLKLHAELQQKGFTGKVRESVVHWREQAGKALANWAFVPLKFELALDKGYKTLVRFWSNDGEHQPAQ